MPSSSTKLLIPRGALFDLLVVLQILWSVIVEGKKRASKLKKTYHGSDGLGCSKLFPDQSKWVELVSGCLGCGLQVELGIDLWN